MPAYLLLLLGTFPNAAAQEQAAPPVQESNCAVSQDVIFKKEKDQAETTAQYQATINTDIRIGKRDLLLLVFHPIAFRLQYLADLSGVAVAQKAAMEKGVEKFLWRLYVGGLSSYAFPENYAFTSDNYKLGSPRIASCQDKHCCIYDVSSVRRPRAHGWGPRFKGTISVDPTDYTIVRFRGHLVPASHMNPLLIIYSNFEFDYTRVEVAPHLWLPERIMSTNTGRNRDWIYPEFRAETRFSNFSRH